MEKKETKQHVVAEAEQENGTLIEDEIERSKVGIMRALCDRQDPSTKVPYMFPSSFQISSFICLYFLKMKER